MLSKQIFIAENKTKSQLICSRLAKVQYEVGCMYIVGGDMFPHASKRPFSGFSAEIGRISSKEKSASTFPNWSKLSIFSLF